MRPRLQAIAAGQGGVFTRRQAQEAGYTDREIRTHLKAGEWLKVRRGVYVAAALVAEQEHGRLWLLKDWAAHLVTTEPHLMSHDSAARLHGLPMLHVDTPASHLTRTRLVGSRTEHGITHHLSARPVSAVAFDGVEATSIARTVIDIAREHGFRHGVVVADAALRRGVTREELLAELDRQRNWPRAAAARAVVEFADDGAENALESIGRVFVASLGLGPVTTQFAVRLADGGIAWCDLIVGCHTIELDGRIKLTPAADGGVATSSQTEILWKERRRQQMVCAEGLGMSRLDWDDCFAARPEAAQRVRSEYAVTLQRFGRQLPADLAEFAARHPRRPAAASLTPPRWQDTA